MKKLLLSSMVLAATALLAACGQTEGQAASGGVTEIRIAQAIDESNPESGQANEAFRLALEEYIGIPVVEIENVSYLVGVEAMRAGNVDIMLASVFNYVRANEVVPVEMLAAVANPLNPPAPTIFITRSDRDDINTLADLEGKSFAFVDAASTSGFLFPQYHLVEELGLDPSLIMNSGYFFDTAVFSGGHDTSLMGVNFGDYDAAAVIGSILPMLESVVDLDDIKIIDETMPTPPAGYIVRSELPAELIEQIRSFMLSYDDASFFENVWQNPDARFVESDEAAVDHVRSMMQVLEFDF